MEHLARIIFALGFIQVLTGTKIDNPFEPMVAFFCEGPNRPAVHRGVSANEWIPDKVTSCLKDKKDILAYCQKVYPDHNFTNVVEASYLVNIPDVEESKLGRTLSRHVRPFRCLEVGFQSDALLVPQHCEFDHRHDQSICEGFSHWNNVADEACKLKGMRLESFGMLLSCSKRLGTFSGVEFVCCPIEIAPVHDSSQEEDKTPYDTSSEEEEDEDDDDVYDEDEDDSDEYSIESITSSQEADENTIDLYEAYLRQQAFPEQYSNEHKKFLAAKERMKKNQQHKTTKLLQEWQAARDHVAEVRKTDPKRAEQLGEEIAKRFQNLYASYQQEDEAEKQQLLAVHQQRVQAALNERKRESMDKYMKALEKGDVEQIIKYLQAYIKSEEKDRMHTVNHFEHLKYSKPHEALRVHPFIVNHLKLSEQRIDQAMEMLTRYPEIEARIRPEIDEFMRRFNAIANSIRNVVLPVPKVEDEPEQGVDLNTLADSEDDDDDIRIDEDGDFDLSSESDEDDDDIREDEHDYEHNQFAAHAQDDRLSAQGNGIVETSAHTSQLGSTLGIALGGVSVFVIIVVAIVMVKRNNRRQYSSPSTGYVEVDPSATPEDRHLANMQMNGYENPTYKYFEGQSNPKA